MHGKDDRPNDIRVDAIAHVTVGVADMQAVRDLWIDRFGLEIVARRAGADAGLARLWNIPADRIADQLLIRTPGAQTGWLHFVEFDPPGAPVRRDAAVTDFGPKNLDVNCRDMPGRHAELDAAGRTFRSPISEYAVDGIRAREVQMPAHDDVNVVLIEVLSGGFDIDFSPRGYGALTSFVVIVPDTAAESAFYRAALGLDELMHHRIAGAGIERAVGLPPGTALDMRLLGRDGHLFGRVELIAYEGVVGDDRFTPARPPARGILQAGFAVASVAAYAHRAEAAGLDVITTEGVETIFGTGDVATLHSPAGLRIDVYCRR